MASAECKRDRSEVYLATVYQAIGPNGTSHGEHAPPPISEIEPSSERESRYTDLCRLDVPNRDRSRLRLLETVHVAHLVLPVGAARQRYPFDWYAASGEFAFDSEVFINPRAGSTSSAFSYFQRSVPVQIRILRDAVIAPFVLKATSEKGRGKPQETLTSSVRVLLKLGRSDITRWYIAVVASIPFLLSLLLWMVVLVMPSRPVTPGVIAGVSAPLLAILPIRLVLVPTEVTELTLVDYWLAFVMASVGALACLIGRAALRASVHESTER